MRARAWLGVVVWVLVGACSSADQGEGAVECTRGDECLSGRCEQGRCLAVSGDVSTLFDVADDVRADLGKDPGPGVDALAELATPDTTPDPGTVDVDPSKAGLIFLDPESYTFTYIQGDQQVHSRSLTITNVGQGTLVIDTIEWKPGSHPAFTMHDLPPLPLTLPAYGQATLTVAFREMAQLAPAVLQVHSTDPLNPWATATFQSHAKISGPDPQPCIQVLPTTLNFGTVVRGQSKDLSFTMRNCSPDLPLVVSAIKRGAGFFGAALSDEFQLTPPPSVPLTIPVGGSVSQVVTYSPGLAGPDSGHWLVKSTDPDQPEVKVNVSGLGVPPPLEDIALHVNVEWDANQCDVDTHLIRPGSTFFDCQGDCHYANPNPDWGTAGDYLDDPFLDYDDVDGFGPENINVQEPLPGLYKVVIHYFADNHDGSTSTDTGVEVKILINGVLKATFGKQQLTYTNETWDVCTIDWPSGVITPLGAVYDGSSQVKACFNFPF